MSVFFDFNAWGSIVAIGIIATIIFVSIGAVKRKGRLHAENEQRLTSDREAYERGYPDRSK